jgi:orotidine-5'-phosphate decarboxylase
MTEGGYNPVICAYDNPDLASAVTFAKDLSTSIGALKLGLEFFSAQGPQGVRAIRETGIPVFLDLKFHDIPNTTAAAIAQVTELDIQMTTIHLSGGEAMVKRALASAEEAAEKQGVTSPLVLGVSVLTSLDDDDIENIGFKRTANDQVLHLAEQAVSWGIKGMVCSSLEIAAIKERFGESLKLIVPGIRPAESAIDDQKRIMTPHDAIEQGADYLVIGRPITQSENPKNTVKTILSNL